VGISFILKIKRQQSALGIMKAVSAWSVPCLLVPKAGLLCGVLALLVTAGCRSPSVVIDKEVSKLDESWVKRTTAFPHREIRTLNWPEALEWMELNNLALMRANEERDRARRGIGQVYKKLLPYVQLQVGVNKRISELDSLSFDDLRWDLNAYAVLSGLLTLDRDVYAAELSYIRSNLVRELVWREKTVELHRHFIASRQLQLARQRLLESERILNEFPAPRRSIQSVPATVDFVSEQVRARQAKLNGELSDLLGLTVVQVELTDESLPVVDYAKTPLEPGEVTRVGVLRRKLLAIELVGAQARVRGAKLQYWPDISAFLTSGPLWTTSGGQTVWWSSEDLRFSVNAFVPIDLNGAIRDRVREAKTDMEFLKRAIELKESALVSEFADKRRALAQAEREVLEQERKRTLLMQLISIEGAENLGERLRQWTEIEIQRESAVDQRSQLNAFFLFFDEAFWTGPTAPAALVKSVKTEAVIPGP